MIYMVYILKSKCKDKFYIGCTKNIENRLRSHNNNEVRSTKAFAPWEIIYSESFTDMRSAFLREKQIKSYKGGGAFKKLIDK